MGKKNKKDFSKLLDIALMSATGGRVPTMKESIKLIEDSGLWNLFAFAFVLII